MLRRVNARENVAAALWWSLGVALAAGAWLLIRAAGSRLVAPVGDGGFTPQVAETHVDTLLHLLLALCAVILLARGLGKAFAFFHQPPVIGEIVAGIALGPSLLGRLAPAAANFIVPKTVAPFLGQLSQVGVILFMFLVGVELDPALVRRRGHATVAISHASIIVPFLAGSLLALAIYPAVSTRDVPFTAFSLFMGVSMSVTAFPVLARILTDRKMHKSRLGAIALTCAAVDDVTAWCLLALVVGVIQSRSHRALYTAALALGYIAVVAFAVRPLMQRLARFVGNRGQLTQGVLAIVFLALLLSGLATDAIGIHAVFGAFLVGAVIPHDSLLARELINRLEDLVVVLFLPAFFAFTGLRTQIGLVAGTQWLWCAAIIAVASLGKFGGSFVAARLTGLAWRDAAAIGVLMNTRGLMELVVLNIGLELKVISPTLFAMLVVMALVTTFATTPLLQWITRHAPPDEESAPAPSAERRAGFLVALSNPAGMRALIDLAGDGTRAGDPPPRLLALVRRPPGGVRIGVDERQPPQAPILGAALDHARSRRQAVEAVARWTEDPARDIVEAARDPSIRWVLLGSHRPVFGGDVMGGVIRRVVERAREVDVAVVVQRAEHPIESIAAVVDEAGDGRAALDLATRAAGERAVQRVTVTWIADCTAHLVFVGADLVDRLRLPLEHLATEKRSLVVVRGAVRN